MLHTARDPCADLGVFGVAVVGQSGGGVASGFAEGELSVNRIDLLSSVVVYV